MAKNANELIKTANSGIEKYQSHIFGNMSNKLFPSDQDKTRFINNVMSCIRKNPSLAECSQVSLLGSIIECATMGLVPDGISGLAHLVPFNSKGRGKEAQLIIGYKGYRKLALRNSEYISFEMRVVYNSDEFSYEFGLEPKIVHKPNTKTVSKKELTHVYAYVVTKSGYRIFDVMTKDEIESAKEKTKKGGRINPVWNEHYDGMAMKTVANRLANKQLDLETDVARAFSQDDLAMNGMTQKMDTNVPSSDNEFVEAEFQEIKEEERQIVNKDVSDKSSSVSSSLKDDLEKKDTTF
tara:strand:+ start:29654 stop:30538 length:885 start_codon:yes stop_codon:yes gene_type:complete